MVRRSGDRVLANGRVSGPAAYPRRRHDTRAVLARWREQIRSGVQSSAAALVPVLHDRYRPASVVDVGCGEGWFSRAVRGARRACTVGSTEHGSTASTTSTSPLRRTRAISATSTSPCASRSPSTSTRRMPPTSSGWLVQLAPVVVFSAAIPGQGGQGHVNEQAAGVVARPLPRGRSDRSRARCGGRCGMTSASIRGTARTCSSPATPTWPKTAARSWCTQACGGGGG